MKILCNPNPTVNILLHGFFSGIYLHILDNKFLELLYFIQEKTSSSNQPKGKE